jgi:heat-inducible transcriptional repressor
MIEEKYQLVELLTRSIEATGLTVVIGSEHLSPDFHPFSLVASTFQDGARTGTVGVIGPTRMRYQRAISVVDGVSQTMTRLLEGQ